MGLDCPAIRVGGRVRRTGEPRVGAVCSSSNSACRVHASSTQRPLPPPGTGSIPMRGHIGARRRSRHEESVHDPGRAAGVFLAAWGVVLVSQFGVLAWYVAQIPRLRRQRLEAARHQRPAPSLTDVDVRQFHVPIRPTCFRSNPDLWLLDPGDAPTPRAMKAARVVAESRRLSWGAPGRSWSWRTWAAERPPGLGTPRSPSRSPGRPPGQRCRRYCSPTIPLSKAVLDTRSSR